MGAMVIGCCLMWYRNIDDEVEQELRHNGEYCEVFCAEICRSIKTIRWWGSLAAYIVCSILIVLAGALIFSDLIDLLARGVRDWTIFKSCVLGICVICGILALKCFWKYFCQIERRFIQAIMAAERTLPDYYRDNAEA